MAILFYLGEFDPSTFEAKLTSILGPGARIIIDDLNKRTGSTSVAQKHHWLGGHAMSVLQYQMSWWSWVRLPSIRLSWAWLCRER